MSAAGEYHRGDFREVATAFGLFAVMLALAACDAEERPAAMDAGLTEAGVRDGLPPWKGPPGSDASRPFADAAVVLDAHLDGGLASRTFTVTTPVSWLAAGAELVDEFCTPLGNLGPVFVYAFEMRASPGLHHTQTRILSRQAGQPVHAWIFGTSTGASSMSWALPAGTAVVIPDQTTLCINYHFLNASSIPTNVLAELHLYTTTDGLDVRPAGFLTMETTQIDLPPARRTSVSFECQAEQRLELLALVPHTHGRGRRMVVTHVGGPQDGETVTVWDGVWDVPWRDLAPRVVLEAGEGLRVQCDYDNSDNYAVQHGANADAEMCVLTGMHLAGAGTFAGTEQGMGCTLAPALP